MKLTRTNAVCAAVLGIAASVHAASSAAADTPKRGGTLNYVVPAEPPGYDGHREGTFAMLQPIRPYYSVLIRVDPNNPSSTTDFVCDVCVGKVPEPTDDGKTYTFKIRDDVKFHSGETMTAYRNVLALLCRLDRSMAAATPSIVKVVRTAWRPS